jgi:GR25 family glycosyltransferase involved in LPS biosynthesis
MDIIPIHRYGMLYYSTPFLFLRLHLNPVFFCVHHDMESHIAIIFMVIVALAITTFFAVEGTRDRKESFDSLTGNTAVMSKVTYKPFVINLDRNGDRLSFFMQQYNESDLVDVPVQRLKAIDGNTVDIRRIVTPRALEQIQSTEQSGFRSKHYQITKGAVGCFLSHLNLYHNLLLDESNVDAYLIFEDDCLIHKKAMKFIDFFLRPNVAPHGWDMLVLGNFYMNGNVSTDHYFKPDRFFGLYGYIINRSGARKVTQYMAEHQISRQIDSELTLIEGMNIYLTKYKIVKPSNRFESDIQVPIDPQFDDPFDLDL